MGYGAARFDGALDRIGGSVYRHGAYPEILEQQKN